MTYSTGGYGVQRGIKRELQPNAIMPDYCSLVADEYTPQVFRSHLRPEDATSGHLALSKEGCCPGSGVSGSFPSPPHCGGCSGPITDRYFLQAVDNVWHLQCLRCTVCHQQLESERSCFEKNGLIYCREDYYKHFGQRTCARCNLRIGQSELVMRVRHLVYHLGCFACAQCNRTLNTGEVFGLRGHLPYCQDDLLGPQAFSSSSHPAYFPNCSPGAVASSFNSIYQHPFPALHKSRSKKKRNDHDIGDDIFDRRLDDYCLNSPPRQKRMRTSFKHHQLRTMKSYFGLNHNPDAKDLKALAEKTGLSKRVLQVWFQNARAKYRRSLLKQEGTNSGEHTDSKTEGAEEDSTKDNCENSNDGHSSHDGEDSQHPTQAGSTEGLDQTISSPLSDLTLSPAAPEFGHTGTDSDNNMESSGASGSGHIASANATLYAY